MRIDEIVDLRDAAGGGFSLSSPEQLGPVFIAHTHAMRHGADSAQPGNFLYSVGEVDGVQLRTTLKKCLSGRREVKVDLVFRGSFPDELRQIFTDYDVTVVVDADHRHITFPVGEDYSEWKRLSFSSKP